MDILPDAPGRRVQDGRFFHPGIVIAHDQEDPRIAGSQLPAQSQEISDQEIIDEIPVSEIQGFLSVPPVGKEVSPDEHGLGLLPEDCLEDFLVSVRPAVEVRDKKMQRHDRNDSRKPGLRQPCGISLEKRPRKRNGCLIRR
ncbi:MAG: hypothetical protein A2Y69_02170 [Candidatus Aminicenantes bacterium RBG_13_59_9]|nr:MAG: hypothetical protein A2Y69_02170 [Candidatus Aminicenantes bacterium RBG_13_59_9]